MAPYGESEGFEVAADLARSMRAVRRDVSQLQRSAATAIRARRSIAQWSQRLPRLHLPLSSTSAGETVLDGLTFVQPWPMRYRAVAVIEIPGTFEQYLRGRSMQAARTNCARARAAGLSVVRAESTTEAQTLLKVMVEEHTFHPVVVDDLDGQVSGGRKEIWFVLGATGTPFGMAAVAVDGGVAQLAALQIALDVDDRSAGRYLLSTEIVRELTAESRDYLVADSMLLATPGVVYLQRRLGFVPMHIVVPRRMRWRRTLRGLTRSRASRA